MSKESLAQAKAAFPKNGKVLHAAPRLTMDERIADATSQHEGSSRGDLGNLKNGSADPAWNSKRN